MNVLEKRKSSRVDANIPVPINKIIFADKEIVTPNKIFPAIICNISTTGALLLSPLSVPINLKFIFYLMDEETKILAFLEIIRKEEGKDGFYYGCRLRTVFEIDRERLKVFVLKKQVRGLKRENYMQNEDLNSRNISLNI